LEANVPTFGFPSGHSTIVAATLAFFSKNKRIFQVFVFVVVALLVGFSRLYLGYHFLLDVIAGLLLGMIVGLFVLQLDKFFAKHNFHFSKLQDEAIVLLIVALAVVAIALIDVPSLSFSALGYYAGFFLCKEAGFVQTKTIGKKIATKLFFGLVSTGIILASATVLSFSHSILSLGLFFFTGFWVSFLFPVVFETIAFKKCCFLSCKGF
jgi:hypothetical protein